MMYEELIKALRCCAESADMIVRCGTIGSVPMGNERRPSMIDYTELVKALRIHTTLGVDCDECPYYDDCRIHGNGQEKMMEDAAAAIEELQAEVYTLKRTDSKRCQECLYLGQPVGEQQLPNRGEAVEVVRCKECKYGKNQIGGRIKCTYACGGWHEGDWFCADGAKMEVQDGE